MMNESRKKECLQDTLEEKTNAHRLIIKTKERIGQSRAELFLMPKKAW